jgi:transketolase
MKDLKFSAKCMRINILEQAARVGVQGKSAHIAPSLSIVEILSVLFNDIIKPHDYFVLSKGHGGLAYYAALFEAEIISEEQLNSFEDDGGDFPGQPAKNLDFGIIYSGGSLGMGLSYACGIALAAKKRGDDGKIYVILGDGELNEGSNWEAFMFAKQQKLGNIIAIIDFNGMQSDGATEDIMDVDLASVINSFGWDLHECEGHCVNELKAAFIFPEHDSPKAILARTVKGKGVSFMENNNIWHHNHLNSKHFYKAFWEVDDYGV